MAKIQCKKCGGVLEIPENITSGVCEYCGSLITLPKITSEQVENLYNRAEHYRRINDYDKAIATYEKILSLNADDPESYWGLVLSKYGIEYVEDPVSHERIPTCHRVQFESILADPDYLSALKLAASDEKEIYESEAKRIAEIQRDILAISNQEEQFDVFICYKENDNGARTKDSAQAYEIYSALQREGLKVFFARITLEDKLGKQYEPYIFAALNSAKVMLVIGSKPEYFNAVWVRNEWSRYLALMKKDPDKLLIPCYFNMDAYDIPEEMSMFQAQNMANIGFIQDILHGIKKVVNKTASAPIAAAPTTQTTDISSRLRRAQILLETREFDAVIKYCEKLLDIAPENGQIYLWLAMAELKVTAPVQLINCPELKENKNFQLAKRFADDNVNKILQEIELANQKRIAEEKERIAAEEARIAEEKERIEAEKKHIIAATRNATLRRECTERIDSLRKQLNFAKTLKSKDYFSCVEFCIEEEENLLSYQGILTNEIVDKTKKNSIQLLETLEKESNKRVEKRKIFSLIALSAIILSAFLISYIVINVQTSNGNVCIVENNKVVGIKFGIEKEKITKCIIPEGVTGINDNIFENCTELTSVTIPDSVKTIGNGVFANCKRLRSVKIPNSVITIGSGAFSNCMRLTSISIPRNVTSIEDSTFEGCSNLTSVTIPNGVVNIGNKAFSGCTGLTSVTIPNGVVNIGNEAFSGCTGLTSVTIPNSVKSIETDAFSGCLKLTSVTIPEYVIKKGFSKVFNDCPKIKNVIISDVVTEIGPLAFKDCTGLTSITIPNSVTKIGEFAFSDCTGLTSITIPNSVTKIGKYAFSGCTGLKSITIPNSVTIIGDRAFSGCTGLTSITISNSVTSIGNDVFKGCTNLTSVTIPNSVIKKRLAEVFEGYPEIKSVILSDGVTVIGKMAFEGCISLTSVTIPNSVTKIGESAFSDCTGLTSITIPNSVKEIGEYAFWGCTGLNSITIPNSVTIIGKCAFSKCTGLTSITIPNSVTKIGENVFWGCTGLNSITIPDSVTNIGNWAFSDCTGLTSITIPDSVTNIGNRAFSDCTGLTSITIPDSVTNIGNGAFSGCTGLTSITIPDSVTNIGEYAFWGCTNLKSAEVPRNCNISYSAFPSGCEIIRY